MIINRRNFFKSGILAAIYATIINRTNAAETDKSKNKQNLNQKDLLLKAVYLK